MGTQHDKKNTSIYDKATSAEKISNIFCTLLFLTYTVYDHTFLLCFHVETHDITDMQVRHRRRFLLAAMLLMLPPPIMGQHPHRWGFSYGLKLTGGSSFFCSSLLYFVPPSLYFLWKSNPTVGVPLFGSMFSDRLNSSSEELPVRQ